MTRYLAIIENTIREGIAKKTIVTLFVLISIIIGFFILALNATEDTLFLFGQDIEEIPDEALRAIEGGIVAFFYQVALFLGVFAIASFYPSMQEKGTIDLLLSRPMSRANIFGAKFIGCMLVVTLVITYLILGTWLVILWKTGVGHIEYLYTIPIFMAIFTSFMAFVAMVGIISRNTTTSAIMAIFFPFIFSAILFGFHSSKLLQGNKFWHGVFETFYWIMPKTPELMTWNINIIAQRKVMEFDVFSGVWTTLVFAVACYLVGIVIFQKRSY